MTNSPEKLCLKWNDFQQNIVQLYQELRQDSDFSDVTLLCDENHTVEAHRIILAACSPFFSRVLKGSNHSHPMIFMKGLKANDLMAIVDFIYHGEAYICQEDLDGFLALAEELQLKGLSGYEDNAPDKEEGNILKQSPKQHLKNDVHKSEIKTRLKSPNIFKTQNKYDSFNNQRLVPINKNVKVRLGSMMEHFNDGEKKWRCNICGKVSSHKHHIRSHVETHIEDVPYPCNQCGKVSKTSDALRVHISAYHRR